jgi:hypothetical protein
LPLRLGRSAAGELLAAYAAAFAVWQALGVEGRLQPALPGKRAESDGEEED